MNTPPQAPGQPRSSRDDRRATSYRPPCTHVGSPAGSPAGPGSFPDLPGAAKHEILPAPHDLIDLWSGMTFTKREGRLFVAMCVFDVAKSISLFVVVSQLAADSGEFWRSQQPDQMGIKRSLSDLLLMATMRVSFLCGIYVSEGDLQRKVALSVAYISFRILTLVGSIYLAMKLAFFEYSALGSSAAVVCAVLMIAGSLVAL